MLTSHLSMTTRFHGSVCAIVGALAVAFTLVGCAQPQTRIEFVTAIRASSWARTSGAAANRPFDVVARDLDAFTRACLDVTVESSGSGSLMTGAYAYVSTFAVPRPGHAELTVRRNPGGMGAPPGGLYVFAVDVDAQGSATVQAILYGANWGWGDVFDAVAGVMLGLRPPCPELP